MKPSLAKFLEKGIIMPCLLLSFAASSQDPLRFSEQVIDLQKKYDTIWNPKEETFVFTGSSSMRGWTDLSERFPNHQIVNTGFGGSQASDLLHFLDELVLNFRPKKVFIYEGDNDTADGKNAKEVLANMAQIVRGIKLNYPNSEIYVISPKPSISRWNLRKSYKKLNRKLKRYCRKTQDVIYIDVWAPMLNKGKLRSEIYVEDGIHMNVKGYDIWFEALEVFVD